MNWQPIKTGAALSSWVKDLAGKNGVYVIKEKGLLGSIIYVGESHTGRLKKTLLRHFQRWKGPTAGTTFKAESVEIMVVRTRAQAALDLQNALILEHSPRLNIVGKPPGFWSGLFGK